MADVYQAVVARLREAKTITNAGVVAETADLQLTEAEQASLPDTPGGKIIAATADGGIDELFRAYCQQFTNKWRWEFSVGYTMNRAAELLDGTRAIGECKIFSGGLQFLVNLPAPLGLGLRTAELIQHNPQHGFYAQHDTTGVYGLPADTFHPITGKAQPLCFWTNHKVMSYQNRFYDPSYGNVYNRLQDMEAFRVTGIKKAGTNEVVVSKAIPGCPDWRPNRTMYMAEWPQKGGYKGPYANVG